MNGVKRKKNWVLGMSGEVVEEGREDQMEAMWGIID